MSGSTPKGAARREALLDGALRVLARSGIAGVTHRAVAAEAGVPVAAATYYFSTIDELLLSALRRSTDEQERLFRGLDTRSVRSVARLLHRFVTEDREAAIAQYELMFLAMRRDELRTDAERWYGSLERAIDPDGTEPERARVVALAIDGLLLRMLWLGDPATVGQTETALRGLLARIA